MSNNPNRPFGNPTTPEGIIARAHRAAPFLWRRRVSEDRLSAARHAVCGALSMQRLRTMRAVLDQHKSPPYTNDEAAVLNAAGVQHRSLLWINLCYNSSAATPEVLERRKCDVEAAMRTLDRLVEIERKARRTN